jgi:predicted hydrocarbon binding protein
MLKAVGKKEADSLADAMRLLETYLSVLMGNRLRATFGVLSDAEATVTVTRCAAFEGARRVSLPRVDQACVACEGLWPAWLDVLLPGRTIAVEFPMRQGKGDRHCEFHIDVRSPPGNAAD